MLPIFDTLQPGQQVQVETENTDDLHVIGSGAVFEGEHLDYLWFKLEEHEAGRTYHTFKVIQLRALTHIPVEARDDPNILGKMVTVLRGLYNARVDFIHLHAGIFDEPALGIVQVYGIVGVSEESLYDALGQAQLGLAALLAAMANYPQSRLAPLNTRQAQWLLDALQTMPYALSVVGQPDPREQARGMGRKRPTMTGQPQTPSGEITAQQNEMVMRGMARVREEYVMVTLASRVERDDLALMLEGTAREASTYASRQRGTRAISFGFALPLALGSGSGRSAGRGYSEGSVEGESDTVGIADGTSHTEGTAHTEGTNWGESHTRSEGEAHTVGRSTATTTGISVAESRGTSRAQGVALSDGQSWSELDSQGRAVSDSQSWAVADTVSKTESHAVTDGHSSSHTTSVTHSQGQGQSATLGASVGGGVSAEPFGIGVGANASVNASMTASQNQGVAVAEVHGSSSMHSETHGVATSRAHSESQGGNHSVSVSEGHASSVGGSRGQTVSETEGQSQGVTRTTTTSTSVSESESHTRSWGQSWGTSRGGSVSDSQSVSDGVSHVESSSHGVSRSASVAQARTYALSEMASFSVGGVPSVSLSKSFQWEDDVAIRLTELLRQQELLLDQMSKEGGYLTDVYVLTRTQDGKRAAQALVPQAFHGVDEVVTPVLTRELDRAEERHLRLHAACFTPCAAEETVPGVMSGYRHASLLSMLQVAAYAAPGVFEEGVALTTQESIPSFAFLPDMDGDVVLGHLVSTETGDLTAAQVRLSQERMFHTVFAGNTGYGKSVAAERLALETTARWHYRTIVLDFGQGWRKMLTAPGLDRHVEIYQLQPGAMRPLRWNPLQFGKRIDPEQQLRAICDLFANAGGMGPRQLGFMRRALIELYLEHGALTADRQTLGDERWNTVRNSHEEEAIARRLQELNLPVRSLVGVHLGALTAVERQALAVYRSRWVDIPGWYDRLRRMYDRLKAGQIVDRTSLEGVLLRLEPLSRGEMAMMYGRGEDVMTIEDVSLPWGLTVFEGGAELDEYAKVALLSMMAWHLYTDAVRRRREELNRGGFTNWMQIFFEEANKVLGGVNATSGDDEGGATTAQQFQDMWRDGRKYRIWLHLMTQSPADLPPGIVDSCNNAFVTQLKNPRDRDLMMAHLALSEKGFVDEHYKRFLSRMEVARSVVKLGYSTDRRDVQPLLAEPLMVPAREPTDAEIHRHFLLRQH
jgi:hypothetical protein